MITNKSLLFRYPGTKPFEADEYKLFKGRDEDVKNLCELISLQSLVILFGRSGLGKSSLLNAGLINTLKNDPDVIPVFLRFGAYYDKHTISPLEKIQDVFNNLYNENSSNFIFNKLIRKEEITMHRLWYFFKSLQIIDPGKQKFILIFDQFEELFTYSDVEIELFKKELSEIISVSVPQQLRNLLKEKLLLDPHYLTKEEKEILFSPPEIRVLFSIRSDRLSLLNKLTDCFPYVLKYCYELQPLNRQQALQAIEEPAKMDDKNYLSPPFIFTDDALSIILDSLIETKYHKDNLRSDHKPGIETFQLQIVCKYAESLVIEKKIKQISADDLSNIEEIFENHYRNIIARLSYLNQLPARKLIEEKLIIDNARVSMPISFILKDPGMTRELLDELINTHILRPEQNNTVEISHDTLIEPILKYYEERRKKEAIEKELDEKEQQIKIIKEQQRIKSKRNNIIILIVSVALVLTLGLAGYALMQTREAETQKAIAVKNKNEADIQKAAADLSAKKAIELGQEIAANAKIINQILFGEDNKKSTDSITINSSPSIIALTRAYNENKSGAKGIPLETNNGPFVTKYLQSVGATQDADWSVAFILWCFMYSDVMKNKFSDFGNAKNPSEFLNMLTAKGYVINATPDKQMPGDIVFFDFGKHKGAQACGMVFNIDVNKDYVYSIEGNVDGKVKTVTRYLGDVLSYARIYETRIYLLTGNKNNSSDFGSLQAELTAKGYNVLGAKYLIDVGRPDNPEVRYFNDSDIQEAEKIAKIIREKTSNQNFLIKKYQSVTAKPGYIEIWLGR